MKNVPEVLDKMADAVLAYRADNRLENLELLNHSEHIAHHAKTKKRNAGGMFV